MHAETLGVSIPRQVTNLARNATTGNIFCDLLIDVQYRAWKSVLVRQQQAQRKPNEKAIDSEPQVAPRIYSDFEI
jgi:hypothetical protein